MALYEAEFTIHKGNPDKEQCMTSVFEAPMHPTTKRPATKSAYEYLRTLARDFGHPTTTSDVHVRVCLYWPPKFHYTAAMSRIGQTGEVDAFGVRVP